MENAVDSTHPSNDRDFRRFANSGEQVIYLAFPKANKPFLKQIGFLFFSGIWQNPIFSIWDASVKLYLILILPALLLLSSDTNLHKGSWRLSHTGVNLRQSHCLEPISAQFITRLYIQFLLKPKIVWAHLSTQSCYLFCETALLCCIKVWVFHKNRFSGLLSHNIEVWKFFFKHFVIMSATKNDRREKWVTSRAAVGSMNATALLTAQGGLSMLLRRTRLLMKQFTDARHCNENSLQPTLGWHPKGSFKNKKS